MMRGRLHNLPRPNRWELFELGIQVLLLPAVFVPRGAGMAVCRGLAVVLMRPRSRYRQEIERDLPPPIAVSLGGPGQALRRSEAQMLYQRVAILRGVILPWAGRRVRLRGMSHVRQGLAQGRGVILWVQPSLGSSDAVKRALSLAGYPLAHLTRPSHGFSPHPFGRRFVNPILRRAENRYLAERILIDVGQTVAPLRRMRALLAENRVISITVTNTASTIDELAFLEGTLLLPAGPIELAATTGAVILPVMSLGSAKEALIEIGPPLPVSGRDAAAIRTAEQACADWLSSRVDEHPLDWIGWRAGLYRARPNPVAGAGSGAD